MQTLTQLSGEVLESESDALRVTLEMLPEGVLFADREGS